MQTIDRILKKYFDHITNTDGLFEVRVEVGSNIFRIFAFFNKGNLDVLGNGFQKKTQKTPRIEIEKALKIKAEYENEQQGFQKYESKNKK